MRHGDRESPFHVGDPWQVSTGALAYFAPCPRGLESALADELTTLGAREIRTVNSGVAFTGDWPTCLRVNLHTRLASRVLMQVAHGRYRTDRDLHKIAVGVAWEKWFAPNLTLRVDTRAVRATVKSLNVATLRVKDGIVDRLRETCGQRPDIDTVAPQLRVFSFLDERYATFYIDTSGENLFKRGWRARDDKGAAPLKENLAAGLLALAGWRPGVNLADPFCGSGTIVIEAASICAGTPAGAQRRFGFENLRCHDADVWQAVRENPGARQVPFVANPDASAAASAAAGTGSTVIHASDIDPAMVRIAQANAKRTNLADTAIAFSAADFLHQQAPDCAPGLLISNPPYGERMDFANHGAIGQIASAEASESATARTSETHGELLHIGRRLRDYWSGWTVCLLSGDLKLPGRIGLKPSRRIPLYNGPIETRLFIFEMR